jgi:molecular chaperone IbpA
MGYLKPVGTSLRTNNMFSLFDDFFGRDSFFKDNFQSVGSSYNIEKLGQDSYRLSVNVAGFKKDEIYLSLDNGYLKVEGKHKLEKRANDYIYKGFASEFCNSFSLEEGSEILDAHLLDGVLHVDIKVKKPLHRSPKNIFIR